MQPIVAFRPRNQVAFAPECRAVFSRSSSWGTAPFCRATLGSAIPRERSRWASRYDVRQLRGQTLGAEGAPPIAHVKVWVSLPLVFRGWRPHPSFDTCGRIGHLLQCGALRDNDALNDLGGESDETISDPEDLEEARDTLAELLVEALEVCLQDGSWVPGEGIVGLADRLFENPIDDRKEA